MFDSELEQSGRTQWAVRIKEPDLAAAEWVPASFIEWFGTSSYIHRPPPNPKTFEIYRKFVQSETLRLTWEMLYEHFGEHDQIADVYSSWLLERIVFALSERAHIEYLDKDDRRRQARRIVEAANKLATEIQQADLALTCQDLIIYDTEKERRANEVSCGLSPDLLPLGVEPFPSFLGGLSSQNLQSISMTYLLGNLARYAEWHFESFQPLASPGSEGYIELRFVRTMLTFFARSLGEPRHAHVMRLVEVFLGYQIDKSAVRDSWKYMESTRERHS